jgi:hypothetical protein
MNELSKVEEQHELVKKNYEKLGKIKVMFTFLQVFIKNSDKIILDYDGHVKLLEIKKYIDDLTKRNFVFFLRQSFMPSLDSSIGDLAFCYGRYDKTNKQYEITLTGSENHHEYG